MNGDLAVVGRGRATRVPTPRWMNATTSQGVSRPQEELDFLPFEAAVLVPAGEESPVPAGSTAVLVARPQRPFRGERLVMSAVVFDTLFTFGVVIDPAIFVGAVQVGAAQGSTPIAAFAANAFGVRLSMPAAGQGTDIKIFVRTIVTPGAAKNIVITAVLFGRAMR